MDHWFIFPLQAFQARWRAPPPGAACTTFCSVRDSRSWSIRPRTCAFLDGTSRMHCRTVRIPFPPLLGGMARSVAGLVGSAFSLAHSALHVARRASGMIGFSQVAHVCSASNLCPLVCNVRLARAHFSLRSTLSLLAGLK